MAVFLSLILCNNLNYLVIALIFSGLILGSACDLTFFFTWIILAGMTDFTQEELETLETLARIRLSPNERAAFTANLKNVLEYVQVLQQADTENVPPCSHVIPNTYAPLREDVVEDQLTKDEFLKNAPDHVGGLLKVPPILQDEL